MEGDYWSSYLYLYGVGGVLFYGVILLSLKKGVISLNKKSDKQLLFGFLMAYFLYAGAHAYWNIQAIGALK